MNPVAPAPPDSSSQKWPPVEQLTPPAATVGAVKRPVGDTVPAPSPPALTTPLATVAAIAPDPEAVTGGASGTVTVHVAAEFPL